MKKLSSEDLQARYKKARKNYIKKEQISAYEINSYVKSRNDKHLHSKQYYR